MPNDEYDLRVTFRVKTKKWRIDDQSVSENRRWSLKLYDLVQKSWINVSLLDRPGEEAYIESIEEL
jgi:hypothetical protein